MSERIIVYHWSDVKAHLEAELDSVHKKMENASGEEMHRLQGEARCLRKMLNLQQTLTALKE